MSENPIEASLRLLKRELTKAKIDLAQAESRVERLEGSIAGLEYALKAGIGSDEEPALEGAGEYAGLTTVEAVFKLLRERHAPMKTTELRDALQEGGFETTSKNLSATIHAALARRMENKGDIRLDTEEHKWWLKEWDSSSVAQPSLRQIDL